VAQIATNLIRIPLNIRAPEGKIQVSVKQEGRYAAIRVGDSGIGITPDLLPRIFDLFARGPASLYSSPGGSGIGLTLVKRLAELHDRKAEALSDGSGLGSTFIIRLPLVADPKVRPHEPSHTLLEASRSHRILVVEDNADSRDSLRAWLETLGHEVYEAKDGATGIEKALEVRPDLALIDLSLPSLDGYEVAARIRSSGIGEAMVMIAVSGYGQKENREMAKQAGFDEYILKPVDPDKLTKLLSNPSTVRSTRYPKEGL